MTEIPEHLLKRSKERRAAMGLPGGEGGDSAPAAAAEGEAAAAPAKAEAAAPAPKAAAVPAERKPEPPKPVAPEVAAAQSRKKVPYWAMPVLALLPLWGILYLNSVQEPETGDALTLGAEVYGSCSGCHGGGGEGGSAGAQLNDGAVLATFPDPKAMMEWVHLGALAWTDTAAGSDSAPYGDPEREGGARNTADLAGAMPAFPDLTPEELAAVTRYIREELAGGESEEEIVTAELAQEAKDSADAGEIIYKNAEPDEARLPAG